MLYSDCYHQYYPFFLEYRRALRSGESLLFSWNVGMGLDYLGLISYYLASPLNLLSVFLPENWMLGYFSFLMPVKLGLASLFFAIFLQRSFRKSDYTLVIFGSFYGLCAWALGYQWNLMWLDTFALLPLVVLGTVSLLRRNQFVLYTLSLFLSILSNYYIGFFTCIFVLLVFICYQICNYSTLKRFLWDLLRIALFSILAIGMTAILELPALAALQTTHSSVNTFPTGFKLNITSDDTWKGLLDAMRQVAGNMNGGLEPTFKEGLPNLYCGIFANILALLFLTCSQVKRREKICSVFLLLFFNLSFILRQLDYIWHGFHFTNMIPYRFSFLYSFVILYMAYRAWLLRKSFRPWQILFAGVMALSLLLCSNEMTTFYGLFSDEVLIMPWTTWDNVLINLETITSRSVFFAYNALFLLLYLFILGYYCKKEPPKNMSAEDMREWVYSVQSKRRLCTTLMLCAMSAELVLNIANFGACYPGTNVSNYPKGTTDSAAVIGYMHQRESDTLFYRAETTHTQTLNDGALNNYNGVTTFTSSANVKVTEFMKALGYGAKNSYNRYSYEESSPVANLFLNLKYMIERDGNFKQNSYFDEIYRSGNVQLLENNAYLPLGFLANAQLVNTDFTAEGNRFLFQNNLMQAATGQKEDVWHILPSNRLTINAEDITLSSQEQSGYCTYTAENKSGKVTYRYTADKDGLLCFHIEQSKRNNLAVYVNGASEALYTESYSLPQMLSVCDVKNGDIVEIELSCKAGETGSISISAAILDERVFRECYDILAASTLELTEFKTTIVTGTIQCDRDGVLYTSIPQNGNWEVIVDGTPAQEVLVGNVMVGVLLSKGEHTVEFQYQNQAFQLGWKISLVCLLIFIGFYWLGYRPALPKLKNITRQKGKFEK